MSSSLRIPGIGFAHLAGWSTLEETFREGLRLDFVQSWVDGQEPGFRPGWARLAWDANALCLGAYVEVQDDDIYTTALPPAVENQLLWRLGDVIEFFVGRVGSRVYHEFHVAPGAQCLRLRFPSRKHFEGILRTPLDPMRHEAFKMQTLPGERFLAREDGEAGRWNAFFQLPLTALAPRLKPAEFCGSEWQVNLARFDATRGVETPVNSATAPLTKRDFHRRPEWTRVVLG